MLLQLQLQQPRQAAAASEVLKREAAALLFTERAVTRRQSRECAGVQGVLEGGSQKPTPRRGAALGEDTG